MSLCFVLIASKYGSFRLTIKKIFSVLLDVQFTALCYWFEKLEQSLQPIRRESKLVVNRVGDFPLLAAGCKDL